MTGKLLHTDITFRKARDPAWRHTVWLGAIERARRLNSPASNKRERIIILKTGLNMGSAKIVKA